MLLVIRDLRVPEKLAVRTVQRKHVGMVRYHEHLVSEYGNAPIDRACGITDDTFRQGTLIVPNLPARSSVESVRFVRGRDIHYAVNNHGSHFKPSCIRECEHPLRRELAHVAGVDLA